MTPPTPVLAPPNGSTADGWLWVSALRATVVPSANDDDAGVADERRAHERRGDGVGGGAQLGRAAPAAPSPSVVVIAARNVLWAQCSLHVWASVSSSTSVGSRPAASKWALDRPPAPRGRGPGRARRRGGRGRRRRGRGSGSSRRPAGVSEPGCRSGSAMPVVQCSMIGLATRRRSRTSACAAVGARRELDAPPGGRRRDRHAELAAGVDDGVGGAVGDAGVERDLDVRAVAGRRCRRRPRAGLQQRVGEERRRAGRAGRRRGRRRRTPGRRP